MRDYHMYIIFALFLLVLFCIPRSEGFIRPPMHHGTPTGGNAQLRAYRDKNFPKH
jgi:hypothetical protein